MELCEKFQKNLITNKRKIAMNGELDNKSAYFWRISREIDEYCDGGLAG